MINALRICTFTDRGQSRHRNEDALVVGAWNCQIDAGPLTVIELPVDSPLPVAVADGMGGHAGGHYASLQAVQAIAELTPEWDSPALVDDGLLRVSRRVARLAANPGLAGLGTTIVGLIFAPDEITAFNCGDSRLYKITRGVPDQLSTDDSIAGDGGSRQLTQALGDVPELPEIEVFTLPVAPARFLLCTDGICAVLTGEELRTACAHPDPRDLAHALISLTNDAGAPDNFTFAIIDVDP